MKGKLQHHQEKKNGRPVKLGQKRKMTEVLYGQALY